MDDVNPKIRAVTSYRRKMSGAVERTLDFSKRLVGALPPPILVSKARQASPFPLFVGDEDQV